MKLRTGIFVTAMIGVALVSTTAAAQSQDAILRLAQSTQDSTDDALKIAALEALMAAPPSRAYPLVRKVLTSPHSNEVKARALFVLSQIRTDEAQDLLLSMAVTSEGELQNEAIRMVGIAGHKAALDRLADVYRDGDSDIRDSVMNAFLIAGDADRVFAIASNAQSEDELDRAVRVLAAMGATDALHRLHATAGVSDGLLQAFAIAGDLESLQKIVADSTDPAIRARAVRSMGIVSGANAGDALLAVYREYPDDQTREAALQGLLVNGNDEGVMQLFRDSRDDKEKKRLLKTLVMMDSDLTLDLVDGLLEGGQ